MSPYDRNTAVLYTVPYRRSWTGQGVRYGLRYGSYRKPPVLRTAVTVYGTVGSPIKDPSDSHPRLAKGRSDFESTHHTILKLLESNGSGTPSLVVRTPGDCLPPKLQICYNSTDRPRRNSYCVSVRWVSPQLSLAGILSSLQYSTWGLFRCLPAASFLHLSTRLVMS